MQKKHLALALGFAVASGAQASNLFFYLAKQGFKQGNLLLRSRPIEDLLKDPGLDADTERYLQLSQEIIAFAEKELGMKTGRSYRRFVDVRRPWVTEIVMAAQKDKLESYFFTYPLLGKMPYRGFFDEDDAQAFEKELQAKNLDTYRRKVDAFSSLGWLPDPLLSTQFSSEERFIETLFHELTHLNFYFKDEPDFNEAFASWMGYRAALLFLASNPKHVRDVNAVRTQLEKEHIFQIDFASFVLRLLKKGKEIYAEDLRSKPRERYFAWIRAEIAKAPNLARLSRVEWNNATVLSLATYYEQVPGIEAYALKKKLSPKDFLGKVISEGVAIVPQIQEAGAEPKEHL